MVEWFKKLIKCRMRGIHKISIIDGRCVRCHYKQNNHQLIERTPIL